MVKVLIHVNDRIINVNQITDVLKEDEDSLKIYFAGGEHSIITGWYADWLWKKLQDMCLFSSEEMGNKE